MAQDAAPVETPKLEVVSIKPATESSPFRISWTPGRFTAGRVPFIGLITMAYGGGAPVRLDGDQSMQRTAWDIDLTFQPAIVPNPDQQSQMLRAVLDNRFHLALRRETREADVYALVLARADGKLGPQFQRSELPCDSPDRVRLAIVPPPGKRPACGALTSLPASTVLGGDTAIEPVTRSLVSRVGRPIVDRTGLTGKFDVVLTFAMESTIPATALPAGVELPPAPTGLPSLFTAITEQLGLKLESTRAPLEYYVIEHVESPTPN